MKDKSKPMGKIALVDAKPISIPMVTSTTTTAASGSSTSSSSSISTSKSISRSQMASRSGTVSRATQTGDSMPEDLQEKRRLIRKQLAVLLHAVLCRVRDELIGNTGEEARPCPTAHCGLMKDVLTHLRTCENRQNCTVPHCLSSRQILSHWKGCTQSDCPVCSSLRRVVPAYLDAVVSNPRWRDEIMMRFQWLITFIGPVNMRIPRTVVGAPGIRMTEEEESERHAVKNSEE